MSFCSFEFLVFLPVVFFLYWIGCRTDKYQNFLILIASYLFYGWWDWRFLFLIAFTSFCSYSSGLLIEWLEENRSAQKVVSALNIILNLLILGAFKYYNFFTENLESLLQSIGWKVDWATLNIILPVGISFYTFQALSYTIDIYQKKIAATHDVIGFFAYISFFPQLVAGPIERSKNILPQLKFKRKFDYQMSVDGCRQMLWGFFKKLVVADNCATIVNTYWGVYEGMSGLMYLQIAVLFSFQIYCDFSGYSDIAIGCSKLFGIRLMKNFDMPYFSKSIGDFWRRWHISLMSWFKDYVYIPLGGSRCSKMRMARNVIIVFLLSGLWHGASWNFVIWGGYNAILIIVANSIGWGRRKDELACYKVVSSLKDVVNNLVTFILVVAGWVIFRSDTIEQAFSIIKAIVLNPFFNESCVHPRIALVSIFIVVFAEWMQRQKEHALCIDDIKMFKYRISRWSLYYIIALLIFWFNGENQNFIYFQF